MICPRHQERMHGVGLIEHAGRCRDVGRVRSAPGSAFKAVSGGLEVAHGSNTLAIDLAH
jgi:hypothetical protein